jgi:hypothetical protein
MTPQDVVSLAPPRGFLTLVALVLTAMASCFWTAETDVEAELVKRGLFGLPSRQACGPEPARNPP